jgi:hypothetical protein
MEKIYIDIPFKLKDQAKTLGAKFDGEKKSWYIENESQLPPFEKVYLFILYKDKDKVKELGCAWSKEHKKWWTCAFNKKVIKLYKNIEAIDNITSQTD